MNRLHIRKQTDSFAIFSQGQRLFAGSSYEVRVDAAEFRADVSSSATLKLGSGQAPVATCELSPDPLRRGVRRTDPTDPSALLVIPAWHDDVRLPLRVELGGNTILLMDVVVAGSPAGSVDVPADLVRWTVEDLGTVESGSISVADMSQVKLSVAGLLPTPLSVTPPSGPFDAYVVVTVPDSVVVPRFPFSDILVAGAAPTWSHQDSFLLPARKWVLRLTKVADDYYADLRAGWPPGAEIDPDGAAVVSAEVNR